MTRSIGPEASDAGRRITEPSSGPLSSVGSWGRRGSDPNSRRGLAGSVWPGGRTSSAGSGLITVESEGVVCRFDDTGIDPGSPGLIHGALLKGVFYEQPFLQCIRSLQRQGVYVDVGASIGTHSVYFAMLCNAERVYAFEPLRHNFERLTTNVALNQLAGRVTLLKLAASDRVGEMRLTLGRFSEVVPVDRLDNLVREAVAVIKIDVEGMEPEVLRGA